MPTLRSRSIPFKSPRKTLEEEETSTVLSPSTPSLPDQKNPNQPLLSSASGSRRSRRIAGAAPSPPEETSGSTVRAPRTRVARRNVEEKGKAVAVVDEPKRLDFDEGNLDSEVIGGSNTVEERKTSDFEVIGGSMNLRSGASVGQRGAEDKGKGVVIVEERKRLDFEVVSAAERRKRSRVSEEKLGFGVIGGSMNLRSGTRITRRRAEEEKERNVAAAVVVEKEEEEWQQPPLSGTDIVPDSCSEGDAFESGSIKRRIGVEDGGSNVAGVVWERFSIEAKGKGKLVADVIVEGESVVEMGVVQGEVDVEEDQVLTGEVLMGVGEGPIAAEEVDEFAVVEDGSRKRRKFRGERLVGSRKDVERKKAMKLAPKFAFFKAEEEDGEEEKEEEEEEEPAANADQVEDWPGPFSTAMKIIEDRKKMMEARNLSSSLKKDAVKKVRIQWMPSKDRKVKQLGKSAPSLSHLCMKVLADNAEEIESLAGVPDLLKHRLIWRLCRLRKMNSRILGLLVSESPAEIHVSDCSWATEEQLEDALGKLDTDKLKILQLDLCGRCMPDYVLQATLARSPCSLPALTKISLKGAYRLSDDGLSAIATSAPMLSSINLSQCSLLTSTGIIGLVEKLELVLKELYIDDCPSVDVKLILPSLMKLKYLEALSLAGIDSIHDNFIKKLISVCGPSLRELGLAGCSKLTDASIKAIGENCAQLRALDLRNLNRLNDSAIGHLANGCRMIQKLTLRRNTFSDEAVAAFVEASGGSLTGLSLNNVEKVAQHTALAISRQCSSNLRCLDLSFCRNMTDEALGLIVDGCSHLRILKLFGCTQVSGVFLEGHTNPLVNIVGLNGLILGQMEMPDFS